MTDIDIVDTCAHCETRYSIPSSLVTVMYHRDDHARDRYQWSHDTCPLTVHVYSEATAAALTPIADAGQLIAGFIDLEFDDPARYRPDALDEDEILDLCRAFYATDH